jgi:effector-binding domain-containing protein
MSYQVTRVELPATVIAATRARLTWSELSLEIPGLFDIVYAFLKNASVKQAGHNVCIYHSPSAAGVELEVGVQVSGPFEGSGAVTCSLTPAGQAATTVHFGGYDKLGLASDALMDWCKAQGFAHSGPSWEVYGDWDNDPAKRRTDVFRLLPP